MKPNDKSIELILRQATWRGRLTTSNAERHIRALMTIAIAIGNANGDYWLSRAEPGLVESRSTMTLGQTRRHWLAQFGRPPEDRTLVVDSEPRIADNILMAGLHLLKLADLDAEDRVHYGIAVAAYLTSTDGARVNRAGCCRRAGRH